MAEFFIQNSIYVVLIIALIVWAGIFFYIFRLDQKLSRLEQAFKDQGDQKKKS